MININNDINNLNKWIHFNSIKAKNEQQCNFPYSLTSSHSKWLVGNCSYDPLLRYLRRYNEWQTKKNLYSNVTLKLFPSLHLLNGRPARVSLAFTREHLCISTQSNNLTNLNQWSDNHPLVVLCHIKTLTPVPVFSCRSQYAGRRTVGVLQWDGGARQMLWDPLLNKRERGNAPVVWLEQPQGDTARRLN